MVLPCSYMKCREQQSEFLKWYAPILCKKNDHSNNIIRHTFKNSGWSWLKCLWSYLLYEAWSWQNNKINKHKLNQGLWRGLLICQRQHPNLPQITTTIKLDILYRDTFGYIPHTLENMQLPWLEYLKSEACSFRINQELSNNKLIVFFYSTIMLCIFYKVPFHQEIFTIFISTLPYSNTHSLNTI